MDCVSISGKRRACERQIQKPPEEGFSSSLSCTISILSICALQVKDCAQVFYGLDDIKDKKEVIIVEGTRKGTFLFDDENGICR